MVNYPWNMMPTAKSSVKSVVVEKKKEARQWKGAEENNFTVYISRVMLCCVVLCCGLIHLTRFEFDNAWWIDDAAAGDDDGAAEAFVLGFQHYLTMVGTAVLIPLLIFQTDSGATPVSFLSCSTSFSRLSSVTGTTLATCQEICKFPEVM
jgi:hypothetical protein